MDDISSNVALEDIQFFCEEIERLGAPRGCFVDPFKTRILTSCNGESILPRLHLSNPSLASTIERTIATYSITKNNDDTTSPVERLMGSGYGTPIGSPAFATKYYNQQLRNVEAATEALTKNITDLHMRLKLFTTCTVNKLPHLLDSDIMHNLPSNFDNENWHNWNGPLTRGINSIIGRFLKTILDHDDDLPTYSTLIAHLNTNKGGLGILNASLKAAPNFVLNMMNCRHRILHGFQVNKEILPIHLHISIMELFDISTNPTSTRIHNYYHISHQFAAHPNATLTNK